MRKQGTIIGMILAVTIGLAEENPPECEPNWQWIWDTLFFLVDAVPNVSGITMSSQLPSCWTLSGGSGSSKLYRTIDKSIEG